MTRAAFTIDLHAEQPDSDGRQWVQLLPAGRFDGRDGRGPYTVKDASAVIARSRARAGKTQLPIDYEHQSHKTALNGLPAPAAGWIVGLQERAGEVWGLVEWTAKAAAHLANREYRYLSPVIFSTEKNGGEVVTIHGAGLTNRPNLDLTAVVHSEESENMEVLLAELRKLLKLDEAADKAAIMAKIAELGTATSAHADGVPDPAKYVPIGDFQRVVAEANKLRRGMDEKDAQAHVSTHVSQGKLMPSMTEWALTLCMANKQAYDDFVEATSPGLQRLFTSQMSDRRHTPGQRSANSNLTDIEQDVCSQMGITADELMKARGV